MHKFGAGVDELLSGWRQLVHDRGIAFLRVPEPTLGTASFAVGDLTGLDRPLRQQPCDDVHDPVVTLSDSQAKPTRANGSSVARSSRPASSK